MNAAGHHERARQLTGSDPPGYVGDRVYPDQESGIGKRQTTRDEEVTGLIRGFGRGRKNF
jgi:hypothetical protein